MSRSIIFKRFMYDEKKEVIQNINEILCEVEDETGALVKMMLVKENLIEAGYELPNGNIEENIAQVPEEDWSVENTGILLDEYAKNLKSVGPLNKFRNKKMMWVHIADTLKNKTALTRTPEQCENRYKTIMKRKRNSEKNNSTSGAKRMSIEFENEIGKIAAMDDSLEPEILQSSNMIVSNRKETSVSKCKKKPNLVNTLLKIHEQREDARQRRHEEKLLLLKSFLEKQNNS